MVKKRCKKNISGLRNQQSDTSVTSHPSQAVPKSTAPSLSFQTALNSPENDIDAPKDAADSAAGDENSDEGWRTGVRLDSTKPCWDEDSDTDSDMESDNEGSVEDEIMEESDEQWNNEGIHVGLMRLAIDQGDDPRDEDWIPEELKRKRARRKKKGVQRV